MVSHLSSFRSLSVSAQSIAAIFKVTNVTIIDWIKTVFYPSTLLRSAAVTSIVFAGAIFGFFFAWVCSTLWGLDNLPARTAIEAMNAMNGIVRNGVFFPAFFLTPAVLGATALIAYLQQRQRAGLLFAVAAVLYMVGGLMLTGTINVPMNNALGLTDMTLGDAELESIWSNYSANWQMWNLVRTLVSGAALVLAAIATTLLSKKPGVESQLEQPKRAQLV